MAIDPAIETSDLTRYFDAICAVNGLGLHVPRGSVYAFLGPNGAGKTTTIRMVLGLTRPDRGEIRVFGESLTRANRRSFLRRIGGLVETPSLYPHLTASENLRITQRLIGAAPATSRARSGSLTSIEMLIASSKPIRSVCASASRWPSPCCQSQSFSSSTSRQMASILRAFMKFGI
jgi:ABC-type multidrug transport system ATPase subunit